MLCTIPDYYKEFSCIAGDCEDTCCAGWQIVIDEKSKRRYAKAATGLNNIEKNLARELRRCVNWSGKSRSPFPARRQQESY